MSQEVAPGMRTRTWLKFVEPEMRPALEACGLRDYAAYVSCALGTLVGRSSTTETRRIDLGPKHGSGAVYLKAYRYGRGRRLSGFLRAKSWIEARNYRILRDRCDVRVPDVICLGSRRQGSRRVDAFIMTRGVRGARSLDAYAADRWPGAGASRDDAVRRSLLASTADLVSRMHAPGFFHVDLQWRNLLVAEDESGRLDVYVIDSARGGLRRWGVHRAHGRLRDLSGLFKLARRRLSRREQVEWLRRYLGVSKLSAREHHALVTSLLQDRGVKDSETR